MSALTDSLKATQAGPSPRNSSVPLLGEDMADSKAEDDGIADSTESTPKAGGKRRLFNFGKKKEPERAGRKGGITSAAALAGLTPQPPPRSASPHDLQPADLTTAPIHGSPRASAPLASPSRYRSSSPRLHSPASSQIFERNVQENTLPGELSPAIPSHIQTEDHIPAVLEASSLAITDNHLGPDEVEIVMHSAHQPAAAVVAGETLPATSPSQEDFSHHQEADDSASNYGALDTADVRRLSFISFADVVQAEHAETHRDSLHLMSGSLSSVNRSPSPKRSPGSSHGISPPTSGAASMKGVGLDAKVPRSPTMSQGTQSPPLQTGGELMVETMRQALRKTGSGDLNAMRSQPMSAVSWDEAPASERAPFR